MPRVSYECEFIFRASPTILYKFFTSPACLIRWFCDEVEIEEDQYIFVWNGAEETAILVDDIEDERLRFKWENSENEKEFFEVRFEVSDITGDTILYIRDFCDDDEVQDQRNLWESQINRLRQETGS